MRGNPEKSERRKGLLALFRSHQVGGEFWVGGVRGNVECRAASSGARTYGRNDVYAESFTSGHNFKFHPASLKKWCDWVYGTGVNHLILHVNIHQPDERKPGIIQWFGTSFNRHNTWFEQSKALIDYTRRCAVLLKAGRPVVDVAYFIGDNAPMMTGPRDPQLPDGYDFDFINSDVLMNRARVIDGRITVSGGPSYAVLVLPKQKEMRPEVARAIQRLAREGATILGPKPSRSPSLQDYPTCDKTVAAIADEVWAGVDGDTVTMRRYGNGMVYDGVGLAEILAERGLAPDVQIISESPLLGAVAGAGKIGVGDQGGIVFQHRTTSADEIFFLANTAHTPAQFTASLRTVGRKPQLWDAVTGKTRDALAFTQRDGRTLIPLRLEPSQSVFVVFSEPIASDAQGPARSNEPGYTPMLELDGAWTVRFAGRGAPDRIVFDALTDWTKHSNPAIRHYAGTAVYEKTFDLPANAAGQTLELELGEVGVIATVFLNGKEAGTVWTTPWRIDVTNLVRPGANTVNIHVTNTWNNRLVADAALPKAQRQSYVSQPYRFDRNAPLAGSGLTGPVRLLQVRPIQRPR